MTVALGGKKIKRDPNLGGAIWLRCSEVIRPCVQPILAIAVVVIHLRSTYFTNEWQLIIIISMIVSIVSLLVC